MKIKLYNKDEFYRFFDPKIYYTEIIEKFINKQIRLGWNYTPGELVGIILRENTDC